MLCYVSLLLVATFFLLPVCWGSAPKVLPRAFHHEKRPAFVELHDVIVKARKNPAIRPRLYMPAKALQKRAQQQQSAAVAAKRELLASRQTCDAGYGYCYGEHVLPPYLQSSLTIISVGPLLPGLGGDRSMLR